MPVTMEMTNWNDTTFEVVSNLNNWTPTGDVADYPVLDPQIEEYVEQLTYNETLNNVNETLADSDTTSSSSSGGGYTFTNRHVAMSVVPHFSGLLSLVGSALIIWDVYRKRYTSSSSSSGSRGSTRLSVYDRLLFGLALSDVIASAGMALSTWPVPEHQAQKTWGAVGTIQSCEFQGFVIQLGLATPLYSAALAVYYVLLVKFNYRPDSIQMLRFEKFSHVFSNSLALATAVICLAMKQYNNANIWCWIAPYPYGCEDTGTCERGNYATIFRMAFYFVWLWIAFVVVTVSMIVLAYTVIEQTTKMDRYRQKGQKRSKAQTDRIRNVTIQSSLYIFAFMVTAVPLSVARIYQAKYSCSSTFFPLSITTVTVFPMQGFWNAIIYFRTRFTKHLTEQEFGKRMSSMLSTRLSMSSAMFSKGFSSSMRSLGSNKSNTNKSLRNLFGGGSSTDFQGTSTQATSQATVSQVNTSSEAGSSNFVLDMSDSEDDDDDQHHNSGTWSIADLQLKVQAMKDTEDDDDEEDNGEGQNTGMDEAADGSERLLQQYKTYLANQNEEEQDKSEAIGGCDVEMDGSQRLLDYDAYNTKQQRQPDYSLHQSNLGASSSSNRSSGSIRGRTPFSSSGMGHSAHSHLSSQSYDHSLKE